MQGRRLSAAIWYHVPVGPPSAVFYGRPTLKHTSSDAMGATLAGAACRAGTSAGQQIAWCAEQAVQPACALCEGGGVTVRFSLPICPAVHGFMCRADAVLQLLQAIGQQQQAAGPGTASDAAVVRSGDTPAAECLARLLYAADVHACVHCLPAVVCHLLVLSQSAAAILLLPVPNLSFEKYSQGPQAPPTESPVPTAAQPPQRVGGG